MKRCSNTALLVSALLLASPAFADLVIPMSTVNASGKGQDIGSVKVVETAYGLVFSPSLTGLASGLHGFHVHQNPSCDPGRQEGKSVPALAAGGHYDPKKTGKHGEPWDDGAHLGDLPALFVDQDGRASYAVLAPRLKKLADVRGRALMVHQGGDNHADHPTPLGGGGARLACGVIPG